MLEGLLLLWEPVVGGRIQTDLALLQLLELERVGHLLCELFPYGFTFKFLANPCGDGGLSRQRFNR